MDCAIHPAAPEQGGVSSVDDGVHREPRDVGLDGVQPRRHAD
jgi:hypothetical protein